jgi:hypothetical protein
MRPIHYCREVMSARLPAVALGFLLLVLPVLAYTRPPDPTWIGGIYDDADYDDVVTVITAEPSPPPPVVGQCPEPAYVVVWLVPIADEQPPQATPPQPHPSRGPPLV